MNGNENPQRNKWQKSTMKSHTHRINMNLSQPNSSPIWVGRHVVGQVKGTIFIKKVKASYHFLRKPPAISIDVGCLEQAERLGAKVVRVIDTETGTVYEASITTIWEKGFPLDRGFGRQQALAISEWSIEKIPHNEQMTLWGE